MGKLDGKVVIVTGAGSGLGKPEAIRMAAEGAKVAICSLNEERLMITKQLCEEKGAEVFAFPCDVSNPLKLKEFVEKTVERFGTIDVLINNVHRTRLKPFIEMTVEDIMDEFNVSYMSTWHMMQLCFPYMKDKPNGASIVNFGSQWGIESPKNAACYASIKEAIRALSRVVAREWGEHNIRVNVVCPAAPTDNVHNSLSLQSEEVQKGAMAGFAQNALHKVGDPYDDFTPALLFFASDDSHYITGQYIMVDGGSWISA